VSVRQAPGSYGSRSFWLSRGPRAGHTRHMGHVILRFYGPLNDFLPRGARHRPLVRSIAGRVSIKDLVESAGPPHPEISLLLANGVPVPFSHLVVPGSCISAYPHCYALDLTGLSRVLPEPLVETRFVVDGHLGRRVLNDSAHLRDECRPRWWRSLHGQLGPGSSGFRRHAWPATSARCPADRGSGSGCWYWCGHAGRPA
jgi:hypothetical protein